MLWAITDFFFTLSLFLLHSTYLKLLHPLTPSSSPAESHLDRRTVRQTSQTGGCLVQCLCARLLTLRSDIQIPVGFAEKIIMSLTVHSHGSFRAGLGDFSSSSSWRWWWWWWWFIAWLISFCVLVVTVWAEGGAILLLSFPLLGFGFSISIGHSRPFFYYALSVCLSDCVPIWLCACLAVCMSGCVYVWLYACLAVCLSAGLSLFVHVSSVWLSVCCCVFV